MLPFLTLKKVDFLCVLGELGRQSNDKFPAIIENPGIKNTLSLIDHTENLSLIQCLGVFKTSLVVQIKSNPGLKLVECLKKTLHRECIFSSLFSGLLDKGRNTSVYCVLRHKERKRFLNLAFFRKLPQRGNFPCMETIVKTLGIKLGHILCEVIHFHANKDSQNNGKKRNSYNHKNSSPKKNMPIPKITGQKQEDSANITLFFESFQYIIIHDCK